MLPHSAFDRLLRSWPAVALAALGAALAWLIAHRVLGHAQPFFAPIAAAVALSSSGIQRGRRAVQLVGGVLLGIAIGELFATTLGTSTAVLGVVVLITMSAAVLTGTGFVGQGMMYVNQAAASAILVVALHKHGTGPERALDALVGGAVALVLGVGLFPADPRRLLANAERAVLRAISAALETTANLLGRGADPEPMLAVGTGHEIHRLLAELAAARSSARAIVRVAPRRWPLRTTIDEESTRTAQLDLLANAALTMMRAATRLPVGEGATELARGIGSLGKAIEQLANAPQPWPAPLITDVRRVAEDAVAWASVFQAPRSGVVASVLSTVALDLELVIGARDRKGTEQES